ncbi:hypothetical protein DRP77_02205 [Candidatus Poribacteria bacterium]|nr:MAG: hypothetical protein DRP77_02205 [Candidatus Poribacteria bacterium]
MVGRIRTTALLVAALAAIVTGCERYAARKVTNLELGRDMVAAGKSFEAIQYLEKAQKEEPDNPEVYVYLTIAYRQAKDKPAAEVAGKKEEFAVKAEQSYRKLLSFGRQGIETLLKVMSKYSRLTPDVVELLVGAGEAAVEPIIEFISDPTKREEYPDRIKFLKKALVRIGPPAVPKLCAALESPALTPEVRRDIVEVLSGIKTKEVVPALKKCAAGTDPVIKAEAIVALYEMGEKKYASQIISLLDSPNAEVRRIASKAISALNHMPIEKVLSSLSDPDPVVRVNLIRALISRGVPPEAEEKLIELLTTDPNDEVQNAAADALKEYGERMAKELIEMLPKQKEWDVRLRIVKILSSPKVISGIDADGEYKLYELYQSEKQQIVKDELARLLTQLQSGKGKGG